MKNILVKVEKKLHEKLKLLAEENHRSLTGQVISVLENAVIDVQKKPVTLMDTRDDFMSAEEYAKKAVERVCK